MVFLHDSSESGLIDLYPQTWGIYHKYIQWDPSTSFLWLPSVFMLPTLFDKPRKPRKDMLYSKDEVKVLSKYKAEYREETTLEMWLKIFRNHILPNIFNYWISQASAPSEEDESNAWVKVDRNHWDSELTWCKRPVETVGIDPEQLAPDLGYGGRIF